jgi:hypothetical protein
MADAVDGAVDGADAAVWDEPDYDPDMGRQADHVPQLHRAMSEAAADLDAVEDRLSTLFDRDEGPGDGVVAAPPRRSSSLTGSSDQGVIAAGVGFDDRDDIFDLLEVGDDDGVVEDAVGSEEPVVADRMAIIGEYEDDIGGEFADLDAELAAEAPDEPAGKGKRRMFRRRAKGTAARR